jgi:ferredoxin-NADP reductase
VTTLRLLSTIAGALLLQFLLLIVVAAWRWRRHADARQALPVAQQQADLGAWPGWRRFRVERRGYEDALQTQCSFILVPTDGAPLPPFRPGQYLTLALNLPGRSITRCYSLSDLPRPDAYRITVKRVAAPASLPEMPAGLASGHLHDQVRDGDILQVKAPAGRFCIDAEVQVPAVFIAGGIGITPVLSMLLWCLAEQHGREVHLYYGLRHGGEHAFKAVLEGLAAAHPQLRLNVAYSQPRSADVLGRDYQHSGYIDGALLRQTLLRGRHQFYVCGPPPMMASLIPALLAWGAPASDIHHEAFGPTSARAAAMDQFVAAPASFAVQFSLSGRTLVWDGQDASLLDFAERHGVAVASGCRTGSCGSCETAVATGTVRYATPPDHEVTAGHCLLCVGIPSSALVLHA